MGKHANRIVERCCQALKISLNEFQNLQSFDELEGWDSLAKIQLITIIEEESGQELTMEQAINLNPAVLKYFAGGAQD